MASVQQPYGELVTTTMRALTWNVWGEFGPWRQREVASERAMRSAAPDVALLQESWCPVGGHDQPNAIVSRWPAS